MNKDFIGYVYARTEEALTENEEYKDLLSKCVEAQKNKDVELAGKISDQMEAKAEELCYIKGFNDAIALLNPSTK